MPTFTCTIDTRFLPEAGQKSNRTYYCAAEATVVFQDGLSRWVVETPKGEQKFANARDAFAAVGCCSPTRQPEPEPSIYKYPSYAAYCAAHGFAE